MQIMKQEKRPNILSGMYGRWKNHKGRSYIYARRIWLYCYNNNLKIPDDVRKVFAEGIHKEHKKYQKRQLKKRRRAFEQIKKMQDEDRYFANEYLIYKYVNFIVHCNGVTNDQAVQYYIDAVKKKFGKKDDGNYYEFEALRQIYYRMKKGLSE